MHTVSQATPDVMKLFDEDTPVKSLLFSILERRTPAEILVDDPERPRRCVVRSGARFTFASRDVDRGFLDRALTELRRTAGVALVCPPDGSERWTPPDPDLVVERLGFADFDAAHAGFSKTLARPLEGMEIREIDRERFEYTLWRDLLVEFSGSAERFLEHGLGLALYRGDEVLACSYAPNRGLSTMEIGVETVEAHRGQGHATFIAAHVISRCLAWGWSVAWSCETGNSASAAIARKLGFRDERTYPVYVYRCTKAARRGSLQTSLARNRSPELRSGLLLPRPSGSNTRSLRTKARETTQTEFVSAQSRLHAGIRAQSTYKGSRDHTNGVRARAIPASRRDSRADYDSLDRTSSTQPVTRASTATSSLRAGPSNASSPITRAPITSCLIVANARLSPMPPIVQNRATCLEFHSCVARNAWIAGTAFILQMGVPMTTRS
jgi:RimJ/RimL family protein N-acetyltransferase